MPALLYLEAVARQPNPPPAADVAQAARSQADNAMLRQLASRDPEVVISQLGKMGWLPLGLQVEPGRSYLAEILTALKPLLA
jgi:hypothetical protein